MRALQPPLSRRAAAAALLAAACLQLQQRPVGADLTVSLWALWNTQATTQAQDRDAMVVGMTCATISYVVSVASVCVLVCSVVVACTFPLTSCLCWNEPFSDAPSCHAPGWWGAFLRTFLRVRALNLIMVVLWGIMIGAEMATLGMPSGFLYTVVAFCAAHLLVVGAITLQLHLQRSRRGDLEVILQQQQARRQRFNPMRAPLVPVIPMRTAELVVVIQPDSGTSDCCPGTEQGEGGPPQRGGAPTAAKGTGAGTGAAAAGGGAGWARGVEYAVRYLDDKAPEGGEGQMCVVRVKDAGGEAEADDARAEGGEAAAAPAAAPPGAPVALADAPAALAGAEAEAQAPPLPGELTPRVGRPAAGDGGRHAPWGAE